MHPVIVVSTFAGAAGLIAYTLANTIGAYLPRIVSVLRGRGA